MTKHLLVFILSLFSYLLNAQVPTEVQVNKGSSVNSQNVYFSVEIPQITLKSLKDNWQDYIGKSSSGKFELYGTEHSQKTILITNISSVPFDAYAQFTENINASILIVRFEQNGSSFPVEEKDIKTVSKYIHDFAVAEYKNVLVKELNTEQKKLVDLEEQVREIDKQENKSIKNISNNNRANVEAEEKIQSNNSDLKNSNGKISDQKKMVNITAADENAHKGANKTMDQIEDDRKDMIQDNKKQSRNIEKDNADTKEEERDIATGKQNRNSLMSEIEQQKLVVINVQNKINSIP